MGVRATSEHAVRVTAIVRHGDERGHTDLAVMFSPF
jgi:hypothetical protein